MKDWLKFFGLGFFSNRLAREGKNRNFCNFILSFALALVFLFCGLLMSFALPFSTFYHAAPKFGAAVSTILESYTIEVRDGKLHCDELVNTFETADGGTMSEAEGYDFIIDTRSVGTFDDFIAYCTSADGKRIDYETYLALPAEEKESYAFAIEYTPNALELDDALIARCESYLNGVANEDISKQYEELKAQKSTDETAYKNGVYELYISCYYPSLKAYERSGGAPLLRTYYSRKYASNGEEKDFLILLDDVLLGDFSTESGVRVPFYGLYSAMADGRVKGNMAESFLLAARSSTLSAAVSTYLNNLFLYLPVLAVIPLFCALLLWIVYRVRHLKRPYIDQLKIVGAFLWWPALFTALIVAACSFFLAANIATALPIPLLFAILTLRTVVYLLMDKSRGERKPSPSDMVPPEEAEEPQS